MLECALIYSDKYAQMHSYFQNGHFLNPFKSVLERRDPRSRPQSLPELWSPDPRISENIWSWLKSVLCPCLPDCIEMIEWANYVIISDDLELTLKSANVHYECNFPKSVSILRPEGSCTRLSPEFLDVSITFKFLLTFISRLKMKKTLILHRNELQSPSESTLTVYESSELVTINWE